MSVFVFALLLLGGGARAHEPGMTQATAGMDVPARPALTLADYAAHRLKVGGDFTLTDQHGRLTSLGDFGPRVVLLFFGYTYCPDICPLTTAKMARLKQTLERQGTKLQPIFVSIDPERDTPARLKQYLEAFDSGIVGLTGSPADIARVAGLYRVRIQKEEGPTPGQYEMAHTQYLFMLDGHGGLRYAFPVDIDDTILLEGVRQIVRGG